MDKQRAIDAFQDDAEILLSTEIGGEGRNMTASHMHYAYNVSVVINGEEHIRSVTGLMGDLIVESKIVGLAGAMPESAYAWRPGDGVRSAAEVFIHLAGEQQDQRVRGAEAADSDQVTVRYGWVSTAEWRDVLAGDRP